MKKMTRSGEGRFFIILFIVILLEFTLKFTFSRHYRFLHENTFYGIVFLTIVAALAVRFLRLRVKRILQYAVICIATVTLTLIIFDKFLANRILYALPGLDIDATHNTMRTLDLYPYSGWHIQANFHHKGDMPWEHQKYTDYDVRSGDKGFFVDFDLNNPPRKKPDEFRIILIGGSGAQGWGGRTNDDMLYRQLEARMNDLLKDTGFSFRVINMAMASSVTYQNFIDLNRFAHPLEPDLILSYSGSNDFTIPIYCQYLNDGSFQFNELSSLVVLTRGGEFPPALRFLVKLFPNLMTKTSIGPAIKMAFSKNYFFDLARKNYCDSRNLHYVDSKAFLNDIVIPFYVHSMESIKRDFNGIPIVIAWQAISQKSLQRTERDLGAGFYDTMFDTVSSRLRGYLNEKWYFININDLCNKNKPQPYINEYSHLGNEGQKLVAGTIASRLSPVIRDILANKSKGSK